MSGGSYNYLCYQDAKDLMSGEYDNDLQRMADRLVQLRDAEDAAFETQKLLLTIEQCTNRIAAMRERLSPVFRAVEWMDSGDSGPDALEHALKKYREET